MDIEETAHKVAIAFRQVRDAQQMVVYISKEGQDIPWYLREFTMGNAIQNFELTGRNASKSGDTTPKVHHLLKDRRIALFHIEHTFFERVYLIVKVIDD